VGLYLNPPDKALVLCVDEKAQIQALDRTQPLLPMRPEQVERRTHDYTRHGTTSLFAALNVKTGKVIGEFHHRHRAAEFHRFLDTVEAAVPPSLDVHVILDNYGTRKTPLIHRGVSTWACLWRVGSSGCRLLIIRAATTARGRVPVNSRSADRIGPLFSGR